MGDGPLSACSEENEGERVDLKLNKMMRFVGHERAERFAHDAMPGRRVELIECNLDGFRKLLLCGLPVIGQGGFRSVDGISFHLFAHIDPLDGNSLLSRRCHS